MSEPTGGPPPRPPAAPPALDLNNLCDAILDASLHLDEATLDALSAAAPPAAALPAGWQARLRDGATLPEAEGPPPPLGWDALAEAVLRLPQHAPAAAPAAAPPLHGAAPLHRTSPLHLASPPRQAPPPGQSAPPRRARYLAAAALGLGIAAAGALVLLPPPLSVSVEQAEAPRLSPARRGEEATAGPRLRWADPADPAPAGERRLRLQVESARPIDQGSLRLRYLRGAGPALQPVEAPTWTADGAVELRLRLPVGEHPIEISVMDDLQREGSLVVELVAR